MAERRLVDPAVFHSPDLLSMPATARLLWIGLVVCSNREGLIRADIRYLTSLILPSLRLGRKSIKEYLDFFKAKGMIVERTLTTVKKRFDDNLPTICRQFDDNLNAIRTQFDDNLKPVTYYQLTNFGKYQSFKKRSTRLDSTRLDSDLGSDQDLSSDGSSRDCSRVLSVAESAEPKNLGSTPTNGVHKKRSRNTNPPEPIPPPPELADLELYSVDTKLCAEWSTLVIAWRKAYPGVDVVQEVRRAHAWEVSNPAKRKIHRARFIASWLSRQQDRVHGPVAQPAQTYAGILDTPEAQRSRMESEVIRKICVGLKLTAEEELIADDIHRECDAKKEARRRQA